MRFWGTYDHEVCTNANLEIYNDPQFEGLNYSIWDLSGISELNMPEYETVLPALQDKLASMRLPKLKITLLIKDEPTRRLCQEYVACCQSRGMGWKFMVSDSMENIRTCLAS